MRGFVKIQFVSRTVLGADATDINAYMQHRIDECTLLLVNRFIALANMHKTVCVRRTTTQQVNHALYSHTTTQFVAVVVHFL